LLQKPLSEGWSDPRWWTTHAAYGGAKSYPSLTLGLLGMGAGSAAEPVVGTILGGATGFGLGSALQTLAPAYRRARIDGLDHDAAVDRALKETGIATAFGAAIGAVPGLSLFGRNAELALKRPISEALAQIFGVQPVLGVGQHVATAYVEDQPITASDVAAAYAQNTVQGAILAGAHAALRRQTRPEISAPPKPTEPPTSPMTAEVTSTEPPKMAAIRTEPPALFDYSHLHEVPDVPQFNVERYVPPRGVPKRTLALASPENLARLDEVARRGIQLGGMNFYNTAPLRQRFIDEIGPELGQQAFDRYMDFVGATSPRSPLVPTFAMPASIGIFLEKGSNFPLPSRTTACGLSRSNFPNLMGIGCKGFTRIRFSRSLRMGGCRRSTIPKQPASLTI
jgi:hypothetical protein